MYHVDRGCLKARQVKSRARLTCSTGGTLSLLIAPLCYVTSAHTVSATYRPRTRTIQCLLATATARSRCFALLCHIRPISHADAPMTNETTNVYRPYIGISLRLDRGFV